MNILVTGGTGYVGSAAVKTLLERGHGVVVLDRRPPRQRSFPFNIPVYTVDLVDKDAVDAVFSNHKFDACA